MMWFTGLWVGHLGINSALSTGLQLRMSQTGQNYVQQKPLVNQIQPVLSLRVILIQVVIPKRIWMTILFRYDPATVWAYLKQMPSILMLSFSSCSPLTPMPHNRHSQSSADNCCKDSTCLSRGHQQQCSVSMDHRRQDGQSDSDIESAAEKPSKMKYVWFMYSPIVFRPLQKNAVHTSWGEHTNCWLGFWDLPRDVAVIWHHYW